MKKGKAKKKAVKSSKKVKKARAGKAKKKAARPKAKALKMPAVKKQAAKAEKVLGQVMHYYTHISVAVVKVSDTIKKGDRIHIKGATTDFEQNVESMQIEHDVIPEAKKGQEIGMKVADKVREGDVVYKA